MKIPVWPLALTLALSGAISFSIPVFSQMNSDYPQKHGGATPDNPRAANNPDAVNDAMLAKSARAYVRLNQLSSGRHLTSAEETDAVKSAGMEPVAYKHVMMIVENDKTLRHKFMSYVQQYGGASVPAPVPH